MLEMLFSGLFDSSTTSVISVLDFMLCIGVSLLIGLFQAWSYTYKTRYNVHFVRTLAIIPAVVCVVIMMVNGNVGVGVAVAGAFGLIRFRSIPGTAKEIGAIFIAMGTGLITGMGYLGYGVLFSVILVVALMIYSAFDIWEPTEVKEKTMVITIPEDLDYTKVFDDILDKYTSKSELVNVKTTNMGSLFKLTYHLDLKNPSKEKEFIDELRCRNGNLEIIMTNQELVSMTL